MKVHAALQKHLDQCCTKEGKGSYQIRMLPAYADLYKIHCSKKADQQVAAAAAAEDAGRAAVVHLSLGRDVYVRVCEQLMASSRLLDALRLSMVTAQVQLVARGDDLRGRKLSDIGVRTLACVGESRACPNRQ